MALRAAVFDRQQIDLDVCLIRLLSQVVVTDEAIEIVGTGEPHVRLIVGDLRLSSEIVS